MTDYEKALEIAKKLQEIRYGLFILPETVMSRCENSAELNWWWVKLCGEVK